jgi:diguanylate cyclase (GGDEF)-like protein/PAS domain S-box-containing protein
MARRARPTYSRAMATRRQTTRRAPAQAKLRPRKAVAVVRTHARQLRESHERFELLTRATSDAVWDWDLATNALSWNPNFHTLFRYPPEATMPTIASWTDFIHPEDSGRVLGEVHAALEGDAESWSGEYRYRRGDDTWAHVFDRGFIVRNASGKAVRMIGMLQDITVRKEAEEERTKSARLYASLSAVNELVARAGSEAELLQGACEIAVASGRFQVAVVRMVDQGEARLAAVAGEGMAAGMNRPLSLSPGSPDADSLAAVAYRSGRPAVASGAELAARPFLASVARETGARAAAAYPLFRAGACVGMLYLRSRDARGFEGKMGELLERMASNVSFGLDTLAKGDALRRFRAALDRSGDLIALVDRETMRYVDVNHALCQVLGYSREELIGMTPEQILPFSREELCSAYDRLIAAPDQPQPNRSHYVCKDGSLLPFEAKRHAVHLEGRWVIVGVARDIRAQLAAEDTLRRFRLALDNSGEMIGILDLETMRYVDVNDPLCAALGYTRNELLQMHPDELIPFTREQLRATYTLLTQGGEVPAIRSHYRCKDGSLLPYESRRHAVRSDGRWLIVSIARDIRRDLAAEEALRRREEAFRAVAENAPDGIMRFDADLRCLYANSALVKTAGRPREAMLGVRLEDFELPGALKDAIGSAVRRAFDSGETQTIEFRFTGPRGERHYQARLAPERDFDGRVTSVLGISRDVTDRKRMEREMEQREARLRSIVHASAEPLLLVDADGRVMFSNPAAAVLFGRAEEGMDGELLGLPLSAGRAVELEILLPTGFSRPVEMQCNATLVDGRTVQVVSLHDLSERKQYEVHIHHLANHDGLTGLPNRTLLRDRVEQAIAHARRLQNHVALMFVDLDQFKLVNDSWGHNAGDTLLLEIASRLKTAVRDGDTVARLGGDEFVVLLQDLAQPGDCTLVARKIESALEAPVEVAGRPVRVTASIGIATFPGDGDDLDALLQCADAAMYQAKDAGRNGYQYYSSEMGAAARARVEIEGGLREALERNELLLHFQPQVRLRDGAVQGCEALLRWQRPGRGLVSPADFIPVAEESGLIVPIGDWVLRAACKEAAAWTQSGLGPMKVAVNLSSRQFWRGSVTDAVRAALDESGLPATQLEVEITESVLARDLDQVMRTLEQLRRMGVCVTIDDFGTGYSSLSYLRSLPIQKLKIDKSFVHGIPGDRQATALVAEIIRLAHVLSLEVVAEGVESAAQGRFLRDAGCEAMQGYYFSRPMPAADCAAMLRAGRKLALDG